RVWRALAAQDCVTFQGESSPVGALAFSADSQRLALVAESSAYRVFELATGRLLGAGRAGAVTRAGFGGAFSPDCSGVAGVVWNAQQRCQRVRVGATPEGKELPPRAAPAGPFAAVAYAPAGSHVLTANGDHTVSVWDAATGQEVLTLPLDATHAGGLT